MMGATWAESIVNLKGNQKLDYQIKGRANAILVWNASTTTSIYAGLSDASSQTFDAMVQPLSWGVVSRPTDIRTIRLFSTGDISGVKVVEVWTESPMNAIVSMVSAGGIPQEVAVKTTVGLKPGDLALTPEKYVTASVAATVGLKPGDLHLSPEKNLFITPDGWTWQKVTAAAAGDVVVKSSAGLVAKLVPDASEEIYLKDGTSQAWKTGAADFGMTPLACLTSIVVNFAGAGAAWILYR